MIIARARVGEDAFYAILEGDTLNRIVGLPFGEIQTDGRTYPLAEATLLAPVTPGKVVAVGLNYTDHVAEMHDEAPDDPVLFLKPPSSVIGPGAPIIRPTMSQRVDFEAELAVVVGDTLYHATPERAMEQILGYTCANDVTARDLQPVDKQWTRAKGFDTFCPLGPWIVTHVDPADLRVQALLNGGVRQDATTALLTHSVPKLLSFISQVMTLEPGDVVLTGTPAGIGPMIDGDVVEVRIEGIGSLTNPVIDA